MRHPAMPHGPFWLLYSDHLSFHYCLSAGSMSKYVPHLRELLPTVPFLSAAYGAAR